MNNLINRSVSSGLLPCTLWGMSASPDAALFLLERATKSEETKCIKRAKMLEKTSDVERVKKQEETKTTERLF